jgi:hypothetical protein
VGYSLELDACKSCYRCYFCHNCENVNDGMFCFNAKNLKFAIGNVEVGKETFETFKKMLLAEILASLEKNHDYEKSIYNIGEKK